MSIQMTFKNLEIIAQSQKLKLRKKKKLSSTCEFQEEKQNNTENQNNARHKLLLSS